jgi:hypothetical protein
MHVPDGEILMRIVAKGDSMKKVQSADGTTIVFDQLGKGTALILVGGAFEQRAMDCRDRATRSTPTPGAALHRVSL